MLILILIDVQYLQKVVFSFERSLDGQNHSTSGSHHLIKKSIQQNFGQPCFQNLPKKGWKKMKLRITTRTVKSIKVRDRIYIYINDKIKS